MAGGWHTSELDFIEVEATYGLVRSLALVPANPVIVEAAVSERDAGQTCTGLSIRRPWVAVADVATAIDGCERMVWGRLSVLTRPSVYVA